MASKDSPRRVLLKKKDHAGQKHTGSWKVAYADFTTAMMAFFLVMWIMGLDPSVREMVQGYFTDPIGFEKGRAAGTSPVGVASSPVKIDAAQRVVAWREHQRRRFEEVGREIRRQLESIPELAALEAQIEIVITHEGLRIELVENGQGETFFPLASAELKPAARSALHVIARTLQDLPNPVVVEGHTDAARFLHPGYTNWELSVDRANAARKALEEAGLHTSRIAEVRGYADRMPRVPGNPLHPANRRITILLPFRDSQPATRVGTAPPTPNPQGGD
ncbi:MAG TPA: flagellar motor protein MotB [Longimicrobiales bacterium]